MRYGLTARIAVLAVLVAALGVPAAARASSLVLSRADGNVWLANADGSGLYRVTLDGTPGSPYAGPSQADDGTIVAVRGSRLVRMTQNGSVRSAFRPAIEFSLGLFDPQISPDGSKIAYWTGYLGDSLCRVEVTGGTPGARFCYSTAITSATGPVDLGAALGFRTDPSWLSDTRLLTGGRNFHLSTYDLGAASDVEWVTENNPHDPEVSVDGTRLAATNGLRQEQIELYRMTGAPPAQP